MTRAILLFVLMISLAAGSALARSEPDPILTRQAVLPGELENDHSRSGLAVRADTLWYGDYEVIDGIYYARSSADRADVLWTFDRGSGPFGDPDRIEDGGGWRAVDPSRVAQINVAVIDSTLDLGDGVAPPILSGERSLWVGIPRPAADSLCYACGAGYGDYWSQRIRSEPFAYNGTGDVSLSFLYFNDSEDCYDGTQIYLRRQDETRLLLNPYPSGQCENNVGWQGGTLTGAIGSPENPETFHRIITEGEIGGPQEFRIEFEFASDVAWSDEDCDYETTHGPIAIDNLAISGGGVEVYYDFEDGFQGWSPSVVPGDEALISITDVDCYTYYDPCACSLAGNILEFHRGICDDGDFWDNDHLRVESPICVIESPGSNDFFLEFDTYAESRGSTYMRVQWSYFPWVCPVTGEETWSPLSGCSGSVGSGFGCLRHRFGAVECGISPAAEQIVAHLEIYCNDGFGFGCFSPYPLFDNLVIGVVPYAESTTPAVYVSPGTEFQDTGSAPSTLFDVRAPGPADGTLNLNFEQPQLPTVFADSLCVIGPDPSGDPDLRWESSLWWRVAKRGPMQADVENGAPTRYKIWRDRVADGREIDRPHRPEFTYGRMDSSQWGPVPYRYIFRSEFREDDDDFVGEENPENEMLWDDIFVPGTRIDYFITANYLLSPNDLSYLPDTTGGHFYEFEVLPGVRLAEVADCGGLGFDHCIFQPATLYIDAYNRGAQLPIENALATVLNDEPLCGQETGCRVPSDRNWDRFDYLSDANYAGPFARGTNPGSTGGMTIGQILGYRTIFLNTGTLASEAMHEEDFDLFEDWLTNDACDANANRQLFIANGDAIGELLDGLPVEGRPFMNDHLGANLLCDAFNGRTEDPDCLPQNESFCVRLLPAVGGAFSTDLEVDGFGSGCPSVYRFNVLSLTETGIGNRSYYAEDGQKEADFAMVVNEDLSSGANYRTILAAPSWHHVTERDPGGGELGRCPREVPHIVAGVASEIGAAMRWGFDVATSDAIPRFASAESLGACQQTWSFPAALDEPIPGRSVNRLLQNEPNPFRPGTTLRFELARQGPVRLMIFDVTGRRVRTLLDGDQEAGLHRLVWDGNDEEGRPVGSGIYWSQMVAGSFVSKKKMVVLK